MPKIERVSMTGERRQVLVSTLIVWPNGITLDLAKRLLYWADARLDRVREEKLVKKETVSETISCLDRSLQFRRNKSTSPWHVLSSASVRLGHIRRLAHLV